MFLIWNCISVYLKYQFKKKIVLSWVSFRKSGKDIEVSRKMSNNYYWGSKIIEFKVYPPSHNVYKILNLLILTQD